MRLAACVACCLALPALLLAGSPGAEEQAVKDVVKTSYVDAVHAAPDAAAMRRGFHSDFRMLVLRDGAMTSVGLDEWAGRVEQGAARRKEGPRPEIRHEFPLVEVTGHAALVRVELYRDEKHTFTDYLSLYKFADGWKIVGKTFFAHP